MRPASLATSLAICVALNIAAIAVSRAQQSEAVIWIQFSTSAHGNTVQHITTAKYIAPTRAIALAICRGDAAQIVRGLEREGLVPIIDAKCTDEKPWSWIEQP